MEEYIREAPQVVHVPKEISVSLPSSKISAIRACESGSSRSPNDENESNNNLLVTSRDVVLPTVTLPTAHFDIDDLLVNFLPSLYHVYFLHLAYIIR